MYSAVARLCLVVEGSRFRRETHLSPRPGMNEIGPGMKTAADEWRTAAEGVFTAIRAVFGDST